MALLQNIVSKEIIHLNTQHTLGRNQQSVNTYIPELDISQLHAIISWRGHGWYIHDQSRNGTLVNNKFINNTELQIAEGNMIQFGREKTTQWKILDCNPPCSYLKSILNSSEIIELNSSHVLPSEEIPNVFIYPYKEQWKIEKDGMSESLINNQKYTILPK